MSKFIQGTVQYASGAPVANGTINFTLNGGCIDANNGGVAPKQISSGLNANGNFSASIFASDELTPVTGYDVSVLDVNANQILRRGFVFTGQSPIPASVFTTDTQVTSFNQWTANLPTQNNNTVFSSVSYIGGPALKAISATFLFGDGEPVAFGKATFQLSQDAFVAGFQIFAFAIDAIGNTTFYATADVDLPVGFQFVMQGNANTDLNGPTFTVISCDKNVIVASGLSPHAVVALTTDSGTTVGYNTQVSASPITANLNVGGALPGGFTLYGNDYLATDGGLGTTVYSVAVNDSTGVQVWKNNIFLSGSSPISLGQLVSATPAGPLSVKVPKTIQSHFAIVGAPPSNPVVFNSGDLSGSFVFSANLTFLSGAGTLPSVTVHWTDPGNSPHSFTLIDNFTTTASITAWTLLFTNKGTPNTPTQVQFTADNDFLGGQVVAISGLSVGAVFNGTFPMISAFNTGFVIPDLSPSAAVPASATENGTATIASSFTLSGTTSIGSPIQVKAGTNLTLSFSGQTGPELQYAIDCKLMYVGN